MWTPDKPTEHGLYHWCDGVTQAIFTGYVYDSRGELFVSWTGCAPEPLREADAGYWQPVPTPAPFIKPTPPKVTPELWEATAADGSYRLIHQYNGCHVAFDRQGGLRYHTNLPVSQMGHTNLRRIDG